MINGFLILRISTGTILTGPIMNFAMITAIITLPAEIA
jgi:hypothetical protein